MKDSVVIDVGCGSGFFSSLISQYAKKLVCLDISSNNLKHTLSVLKSTNIEGLVSDSTKIDLPDGETDIVFCSATIEHFEDPVAALSEFHRILRAKGKLILTVDINPKITGSLRNYAATKAEMCSEHDMGHPEVHKKSIFSDDNNPKFFDIKKLKNFLAENFEIKIEDYGGGVFSNIIDSFLIIFNALGRPKEMDSSANLSDHYSRLTNPLIRFYIKTILPIIKIIAKYDNYQLDAFVVLLVYKKNSMPK